MANIAIIIGNSQYANLSNLSCCHDDVLAIEELLLATEKYSDIQLVENLDADALKSKIREIVDCKLDIGELFFYFSGHGQQTEHDFFFCASNYDSHRPNETGISNTELHTLLRLADADLVVKVLDACNSGTILIKSDGGFLPELKHGFKSLIQVSSCLDSQNSLTGNPLSIFTDKFRNAALRKSEGIVYYTDISFALRDEFLNNNAQTPFFVSQGTGRERFVDNAKLLDALRTKLNATSSNIVNVEEEISIPSVSLQELLTSHEADNATPTKVSSFISSFFDSMIEKMNANAFTDYFKMSVLEYPDFRDEASKEFIVKVLSQTPRQDNFVTAEIKHEGKRTAVDFVLSSVMRNAADRLQSETTKYELKLNCSLSRAQITFSLIPNFQTLKMLSIAITCAPSLERCFIFQVTTEHVLRSFSEYEYYGREVNRTWFNLGWNDNVLGVSLKIFQEFYTIVNNNLELTRQRLEKDH